ncbi:hypothetical protein G6F59_018143 [Rhizopus arrhizus]|nr:hypothetical protein G6F59_018143 [Rhizopus arrhizus]
MIAPPPRPTVVPASSSTSAGSARPSPDVAFAPLPSRSCSSCGRWPRAVSEGGASSTPLPQRDGLGPITKSSVAPLAISSCGTQVLVQGLPLSFSDCT